MPQANSTIYFTAAMEDMGGRVSVTEAAAEIAMRYQRAMAKGDAFYLATHANNGMKMYVPTRVTGPIMEYKS